MVKDTKIIDGMRRSAIKGKLIGRIPFGYILRNNEIEILTEESDIVQQIFRMYYEKTLGYSDISSFLNSQGLYRRGKKWRRDSVKRTIRNMTYYGITKIKGEFFEGDFPPIIKEKYTETGKTGRRTDDDDEKSLH